MKRIDRLRKMCVKDAAELIISADFCTVCEKLKQGICDNFTNDEPIHDDCVKACVKYLNGRYEE